MNKRTIHKINGGIAIYFGISTILGSIGILIGIGVWLFKILMGQSNFSWWVLISLTILAGTLGFIGYSVLKVGNDEYEK